MNFRSSSDHILEILWDRDDGTGNTWQRRLPGFDNLPYFSLI